MSEEIVVGDGQQSESLRTDRCSDSESRVNVERELVRAMSIIVCVRRGSRIIEDVEKVLEQESNGEKRMYRERRIMKAYNGN